MEKELAKQKFQNGEIQIYNDDKSKLELLQFITDKYCCQGKFDYYKLSVFGDFSASDLKLSNLPIVKISEIEEIEESILLGRDMQIWSEYHEQWINCYERNKYRLKPKPNYQSEIEALQNKAKENGEKVIITFEKL